MKVYSEPVGPSVKNDDSSVIKDVLSGNREVFEVLVRRHNQQLYRVGMAYLKHHARVEDAMQNAYLKAFLHLGSFDQKSSAATWLTRIMINECRMILRRQRQESGPTLRPEVCPFHHANGESHLTMKEKKILLEQAIAVLPARSRRVFVLREIQHLSTAETAGCLSLTRANVRVLLHRAHEELKSSLLRHAAGAELFDYPAAYCDPLTARVMRSILAVN